MNEYQRMARAMEIFNKYTNSGTTIHAEHDELYAGPHPDLVSESDKAELNELGWHPDPYYGMTFYMFT